MHHVVDAAPSVRTFTAVTATAPGPQAQHLETMLRVARAMSVQQVIALGAVAHRDAAHLPQMRAARQVDPGRSADLETWVRARVGDVFPEARRYLHDTESRMERHTGAPRLVAAVLSAAGLGLVCLLGAALAALGATSWTWVLAGGATAALTLAGAVGSVVARVRREDRRMTSAAQRATHALLNALCAVSVADLVGTVPTWDAQAYRTLTDSWAQAVLPVPPHAGTAAPSLG